MPGARARRRLRKRSRDASGKTTLWRPAASARKSADRLRRSRERALRGLAGGSSAKTRSSLHLARARARGKVAILRRYLPAFTAPACISQARRYAIRRGVIMRDFTVSLQRRSFTVRARPSNRNSAPAATRPPRRKKKQKKTKPTYFSVPFSFSKSVDFECITNRRDTFGVYRF